MTPYYADDRATVLQGDCLDVLRELPDNSVDAVVTDPPYGLEFMGKDWDTFGGEVVAVTDTVPIGRQSSTPFAGGGQRVRYGAPGVAFQLWCQQWATEALRVLKPGGHMLAFGGTRTYHRLTCGIEDAGFEIRDCLAWLYGSGFPKSLRVSRDERYCHCDASVHTSSYTSPEPQTGDRIHTADASGAVEDEGRSAHRVTLEPLGSPAGYRPAPGSGDAPLHPAGVGALTSPLLQADAPAHIRSAAPEDDQAGGSSRSPSLARRNGHPSNPDSGPPAHSPTAERLHTPASKSPAGTSGSVLHTQDTGLSSSPSYGTGFPRCSTCGKLNVDGVGTALKPSYEPVVLARKPLQGTVAGNVQAWGTGGLNIDGTRISISAADDIHAKNPHTKGGFGHAAASVYGSSEGAPTYDPSAGRWPANVTLDEAAAQALDQQSGESTSTGGRAFTNVPFEQRPGATSTEPRNPGLGDTGGASRFFYTAKAGSDERITHNGIAHPTVKPLALMRWLVRLITPPRGVVLDCFAGSGATVEAALLEGFRCIAIEREPDYLPMITQRIHRRRDPIAYLTQGGHDLGLFDDDEDGAA